MSKLSTALFWLGTGIGLGIVTHRVGGQNRPVTELLGPSVLGWIDRGKSDQELIDEIKASGIRLKQQLMNAQPTQINYRRLNHVIGIERWGQRRLAVALGEPFRVEEYGAYRPARGMSWNELQDQFAQCRDETIRLAEAIRAQGAGHHLILHNSYGELTPAMWLTYLRIHADFTLKKVM